MTTIRKIFAASLAALTVAGTLIATAGSAEAAWRHRHHGWHGGAVAAGVVGALALGAIAASAANAAPVYEDCGYERRPVYNRFGEIIGWRRVAAC